MCIVSAIIIIAHLVFHFIFSSANETIAGLNLNKQILISAPIFSRSLSPLNSI